MDSFIGCVCLKKILSKRGMGLCARGGGCSKVMGVYYIFKKLKAKKLAHEKNQGHFLTEKLNVSETFEVLAI